MRGALGFWRQNVVFTINSGFVSLSPHVTFRQEWVALTKGARTPNGASGDLRFYPTIVGNRNNPVWINPSGSLQTTKCYNWQDHTHKSLEILFKFWFKNLTATTEKYCIKVDLFTAQYLARLDSCTLKKSNGNGWRNPKLQYK